MDAKTIAAVVAVDAIVADLSGRSGLSDEWDQIDGYVQDEIKTLWIDIILTKFKDAK